MTIPATPEESPIQASVQELYSKVITLVDGSPHVDASLLSRLLETEPQTAEQHFILGMSKLILGEIELKNAGTKIPIAAISNLEAAVKRLQQAALMDPLHFRSLYNLGISHYELARLYEDQDRAIVSPRKVEDHSVQRSRTEQVESRKSYLAAIDALRNPRIKLNGISLSPQQLIARCNNALGILSLESGRFDEAVDFFNAALALDPALDKAIYYKGVALHNQHRYREAIECFLAAQKSRPNDPLPWNDCGNSYFNSGDLEQAKYCYLEAMKLSELYGPKLGSIYNNIAWCLLSKEHPDDFEAEKYLSKSFDLLGIEASHLDLPDYLKIDGLNAVAKRTLIQGTALYGLVHYIRGSYDQASKFLTYSVSVAEHYSLDEPYPYLYLGNVYFKTGRFQDAERSYAQAKKFGKQYAEACDSYGVALSKNDKAQDALQEFQTAVRLKPSLVPSVLHLTRTQAYLDSGGKSVSESPKFIAYWSKSKKRGMTALALIGIAAILAATSVVIGDHVSDVRSVSNLGNANLTTTTSITETRSVSATSMILVGIIVFVLLFPDLRSTKVSRLELNLQGETAGYHNRLHAETNSSLEIFLR